MRPRSPRQIVALAEAQAKTNLQRERTLNAAIERNNPSLRPTERYLRGPLPSNDPRFATTVDVIRYRATRTMGKFDPHARYPAPPPRPTKPGDR